MKITRKKIMEYNIVFNYFASLKGSLKFHYNLRKNINLLSAENTIINDIKTKALTQSEEYNKYDEERKSICEKFCERNEDGTIKIDKVITDSGILENYSFTKENKFFLDKEMELLSEKHKDALEQDKKEKEEFFSFLEEEVDIDFIKFNINDMPQNEQIEQKYINTIFDLIEE